MQNNLEQYVAECKNIDFQYENKPSEFITVMFTELNSSTAINESGEEMSSSTLFKSQSDIFLPIITDNNGVFLKSIKTGTLSYFKNALDAVRAAAQIQGGMDAFNMSHNLKHPVLMRIGMHSGKCVVEKKAIHGDAVNTAFRFQSAADSGGILMSEDTYLALTDKSEICCRFAKQMLIQGKQETYNAYRAFWNPREIELDKQGENVLHPIVPNVPTNASGIKLVGGTIVLIGLVLLLTLGSRFFGTSQPIEDTRVFDGPFNRTQIRN